MKKFLSYVLTFVLLFIISAVATITFANSGAVAPLNPGQTDIGSASSALSGLMSAFENNKKFNVKGGASILVNGETLELELFLNADISDSNFKFEGLVGIKVDENYEVLEFEYFDKTIFVNYKGNSIKVSSSTITELKDLIEDIVDTSVKEENVKDENEQSGTEGETPIEESQPSGFVEKLMPSLMDAMNNLTEEELDGGDKRLTISVENLADVEILSDKDNVPKKVDVVSTFDSNLKIKMNLEFDFSGEFSILSPEKTHPSRDYFDARSILNIASSVKTLSDIEVKASLEYSGQKTDLNFIKNRNDGNYSLKLNSKDFAKISYLNGSLFLTFNDSHVLVSHDLIKKIGNSVSDTISEYKSKLMDKIDGFDIYEKASSALKNINIIEIIAFLKDMKINSSGMELVFDSKLLKTDADLIINVVLRENSLPSLILRSSNFKLSLDVDSTEERVEEKSEQFLDIDRLFDINYDLLSSQNLSLKTKVDLKGEKEISLNGKFNFDRDFKNVDFVGQLLLDKNFNFDLALRDEVGYIALNNAFVKLDINNLLNSLNIDVKEIIESTKSKLSEKVDKSNIDIQGLIQKLFADKDSLPIEIVSFKIDNLGISLCIKDKESGKNTDISISLDNHKISMINIGSLQVGNENLSICLSEIENDVSERNIDETKYLDIDSLVNESKEFFASKEYFLNGKVQFSGENNGSFEGSISFNLDNKFVDLIGKVVYGDTYNLDIVNGEDYVYMLLNNIGLKINKSDAKSILNGKIDLDRYKGELKEKIGELKNRDFDIKALLAKAKINSIEISKDLVLASVNYNDMALSLEINLENYKIKSIKVSGLKVEGNTISAEISEIDNKAKNRELNEKKYIDLSKLVSAFKSILNDNVHANITAQILNTLNNKNISVNADIVKELRNGELLGNLDLGMEYNNEKINLITTYIQNTIFASLNGLKVRLSRDDIIPTANRIVNLLNKENSYNDILSKIVNLLSGESILNLASGVKIDKSQISNVNIKIDEILSLISSAQIDSDKIHLTINKGMFGLNEDLTLDIVLGDYQVKSISAKGLEVKGYKINANITLSYDDKVRGIENSEIENYIDVARLSEVAVVAFDTVKNLSISGNFNFEFTFANEKNFLDVSYGIRLVDRKLQMYFETEFKGLKVNIYYINSTFYLDIVGLKVFAEFKELNDIIEFLNTEFDLNIDFNTNQIDDLIDKFNDYENDLNNGLDFDKYFSKLANADLGFIKNVEFNANSLVAHFNSGVDLQVTYNDKIKQVVFIKSGMNFEINCTKFDVFAFDLDYNAFENYKILTDTYYSVRSTLADKMFNIGAVAEAYKNNQSTDKAEISLELNIDNTIEAFGNLLVTGSKTIDLNVAYENKMMYVDFDNDTVRGEQDDKTLKVKMERSRVNELLAIVLSVLNIDPETFSFLNITESDLDIRKDELEELIPGLDFGNPLNMLKLIKNIDIVNKVFILTLDGTVLNPLGKKDITIEFFTGSGKVKYIKVLNFYTGNGDEYFDFTLEFKDLVKYNSNGEAIDFTVSKLTAEQKNSYIDISESPELIRGILNTMSLHEFHIDGNVLLNVRGENSNSDDLSLASVGVNIDVLRPAEGDVVVQIELTNYPSILGLTANNNGGAGSLSRPRMRNISIYIIGSECYLKTYDADWTYPFPPVHYEERTRLIKMPISHLIANLKTYLQWLLGFANFIETELNTAIDRAMDDSKKIDITNVLNAYSYDASTRKHHIDLNLAELSKDPTNTKVGSLNIDLITEMAQITREGDDHKRDYLSELFLDIDLLGLIHVQTDSNNKLNLHLGDKAEDRANVDNALEHSKFYFYNELEEVTLTPDSNITIILNNNGETSNLSGKYNSDLNLPSYEDQITDDGEKVTTLKFLGWYYNGERYTKSKFSENITLEARYEESVRYYRYLSYGKVYGNTLRDTLKILEGEELTLVPYEQFFEIYDSELGLYRSLEFMYWQDQEGNRVDTIKIDGDTLITPVIREVCEPYQKYSLKIYDTSTNEYIVDELLKAGTPFTLPESINDPLLYLTFANDEYSNLLTEWIMPENDLTLYLRKKFTITLKDEYTSETQSISDYSQAEITLPHNENKITKDHYMYEGREVKADFEFKYWVDENGNQYDSIYKVGTKDVTLTAVWDIDISSIKHYYVVTFNVKTTGMTYSNNQTSFAYDKLTLLEGETLDTREYTPTCAYKVFGRIVFTFDYWKLNGNKAPQIITITEDITLEAVWKR